MTTRDDFLKAILSDPDDDTLRLVFADWLDENAGVMPCRTCLRPNPFVAHGPCGSCHGTGTVPDGNAARAEFIRVQVELAGTDSGNWSADPKMCECRMCVLRRREREWLSGNWKKWGGAATNFTPQGAPFTDHIVFRRGFLAELTCTAEDWLRHADALFWHPSQRVKCPECEDESPYRIYCDCGKRSGQAGKVYRPFVPTAQPLRGVTLTTLPRWDVWRWGDADNIHIVDDDRFTDTRWPGVTFAVQADVGYTVRIDGGTTHAVT